MHLHHPHRSLSRGFTLIELLVVITIIGLLSTVVLASLGSARAKSRDARRLSDLKQIATTIALGDGTKSVAFAVCTTAGTRLSTCTTPVGLTVFTDPSEPSALCPAGASATASAPCDYTVANAAANTQNWKVCTYLEARTLPLTTTGGLVSIGHDGNVVAGCN